MKRRGLPSNSSSFAILAILDALGYRSVTDEIVARMVSDVTCKVFDRLGEHLPPPLVIQNLCKANDLTEQQLFQRCDLVEKSIVAMFADASEFIIEQIKEELLPFSLTKNLKHSLNRIADEIKEAEVIKFIRNLAGHEHVGFIYGGEATKDALLSQFFDSAPPEASKGLISLDGKGESGGIRRMVYDDLKMEEKSKALDVMFDWLAGIHKSNRSGRETRLAGEDASWFLRNGFAKEFLAAEKGLGRHLHDKMSVLCSYNAEGIALASQLKTVIESHRHVIIDQPLAVYAAPE